MLKASTRSARDACSSVRKLSRTAAFARERDLERSIAESPVNAGEDA
jgi:hypothetical protein